MLKIVLFLFLGILAGCASWSEVDRFSSGGNTMPDETARQELVGQYPDLTPAQKTKFIRGTPWIGMPQDQFEAMMGGKATKSQRKLSAAGEEDVQLYHERVGDWKTGIHSKYFRAKMREGKLVEFQELDEAGSLDRL